MATRTLSTIIILVLFFPMQVINYEKTLRKIVRNQSKMIQRPFSDSEGEASLSWSKVPGHQKIDSVIRPGFTQTKVLNRIQRPKMSTILSSSVETARGKSAQMKNSPNKNYRLGNELRQARNIAANVQPALQTYMKGNEYFTDPKPASNLTPSINLNVDQFYRISSRSNFFPHLDDQDLQNIDQKSNKLYSITIPENVESKVNDSFQNNIKSIFIADRNITERKGIPLMLPKMTLGEEVLNSEAENEKADFFLIGSPVDIDSMYSFNASVNPYFCKALKITDADIDAQEKFSALDIEPPWTSRNHFWSAIYDSRYESLMRNPKWPPLKVILVPLTHVDSIWKKPFENYYNDSVGKILSNIVKKLHFYSNMTFTWNEVSHLSQWWKRTSHKSRSAFRRLLKSGRIEITTGTWVEPDEATTDLFGLVHLLVEGHAWLKNNLNYTPKTGWLTNTVTHSPTMTYLLSTLDIVEVVITNIHYSWEQYLSEYQYSDFVWLQNWDTDSPISTPLNDILNTIGKDRYPKNSVLTHYLQFNSDGFKACGPNKAICSIDYNFARFSRNLDINTYNVKEKSEVLLEQYSKTGTITPHNIIIAPIGGPYAYENQPEFDFQYNNYQKIADFINFNRDIYKATIEFGTPKDYFKTLTAKMKKFTTLKGDFLNFADINSGTPAYWVGFYTSRPFFKIMLRRLESTLRTTEILFSFALGLNTFRGYNFSQIFDNLLQARESLARLLDRNVASGTLPSNVLRYAHNLVLKTVANCWSIQEVVVSLLTTKPGFKEPYLKKYIYREGEFISTFKTVSPDDQIYIFNSLSHEKTEVIELVTRHTNIRIVDFNNKDITLQINPIWTYNSENFIKISRRYFKINFVVVIPPMTLELYRIKITYDASQNAALIYCSSCFTDDVEDGTSPFPFNIQPVQSGDILLESYKYRVVFDESTGLLKTLIEKETNIAKQVVIDFGAFRDADINSGMFLFNTNVSKPLVDIILPYRVGSKSKITMITSGYITTELTTVFGRFLQHTVKIYNMVQSPLSNAIYIENKVDYDVSPKHRDLEFFMSIQTEIGNGNPPQIFTDNNGFQYTARVLNLTRRVESNVYPITSMAYIQDFRSRLTYLTDHAQGVTALQEGQLVIMMDRRVLFNDGRGANEGLADSTATYHRQILVFENLLDHVDQGTPQLSLPSLSAIYLSNTLNHQQDIFLVEQNKTNLCHYGFLPLIKIPFPCDVAVVNYRVIPSGDGTHNVSPNTALLILHRQSFTCRVTSSELRCNGELDFSLDKILRNVRAVYQTNLAGTNKGTPVFTFSPLNIPPMELSALKVYF